MTEPRAIILDTRFCSPTSDCTSLYCSVKQKLNGSLDLKPTQTETGTLRMTPYPRDLASTVNYVILATFGIRMLLHIDKLNATGKGITF